MKYTSIDQFEYKIENNNILLKDYIGKDIVLNIAPKYKIDNKEYNTILPDNYLLEGKKIEKISFPNTVTEIPEAYCYRCFNLKDITLPESIREIKPYAFAQCNMKNITLPKQLKTIHQYAFDHCLRLNSVIIPDEVNVIDESAFYNCKSLESIKLPKKLKNISRKCFCNCSSLKEINLPDTITKIEFGAFRNCTKLKKINIPKNIQQISEYAFLDCDNLQLEDFENKFYKIKNNNIYEKEIENDETIYILINYHQKDIIINENEKIFNINKNTENIIINSHLEQNWSFSTSDIRNFYITNKCNKIDYVNSFIRNLYYNGSLEQFKLIKNKFRYTNLIYQKNVNELLNDNYNFKQIDLIIKGYQKNILLSNINPNVNENIIRDIINNYNYDNIELYDILELLNKENITLEDQIKIQEKIQKQTKDKETSKSYMDQEIEK